MKKLLGISLVAILAVTPLMANAAAPANQGACESAGGTWDSTANGGAGACTGYVIKNAGDYALQDGITDNTKGSDNETEDSSEAVESGLDYDADTTPVAEEGIYFKGKSITDTDAATAATGAYVKGAYNAAISAINKVAKDTADNYATKEGVVSTIESASVKSVTGVTLTNVAGVSAYTDWADETTATLGGGTPTATLTYGRENVVITRGAGDADTVANKYHASTSDIEHPDVLTGNETSADASTLPYVDQNGVTHTVIE